MCSSCVVVYLRQFTRCKPIVVIISINGNVHSDCCARKSKLWPAYYYTTHTNPIMHQSTISQSQPPHPSAKMIKQFDCRGSTPLHTQAACMHAGWLTLPTAAVAWEGLLAVISPSSLARGGGAPPLAASTCCMHAPDTPANSMKHMPNKPCSMQWHEVNASSDC